MSLLTSIEDTNIWLTARYGRSFCTFHNLDCNSEIDLYDTYQSDGTQHWCLVERGMDDQRHVLKVYIRPFGLDSGAKPPMTDVLRIVYERFGWN
jgi:hypothetical protein